MKKKELLTLREYAKKCGTTHQTISTAIKNGQISEAYDPKTQKIDSDKADLEWGIAFMEKRLIKDLQKQGEASAKAEVNEGDNMISVDSNRDIPSNTKSGELFRLQLLFNTRLARIKLLEAEGKLVDKDSVYKQLYQFGQNLRQQLQALPERLIDEMLAGDRDAAKQLFDKEIQRILELSAKYEDDFNTGNM